ncbi:uncharacterized protein [Centruroides vittatus]|uniref:uncharacterized protein n=1 Tax=Centruroides vittatus TaxID=120091 RepID=UPI00350F85DB
MSPHNAMKNCDPGSPADHVGHQVVSSLQQAARGPANQIEARRQTENVELAGTTFECCCSGFDNDAFDLEDVESVSIGHRTAATVSDTKCSPVQCHVSPSPAGSPTPLAPAVGKLRASGCFSRGKPVRLKRRRVTGRSTDAVDKSVVGADGVIVDPVPTARDPSSSTVSVEQDVRPNGRSTVARCGGTEGLVENVLSASHDLYGGMARGTITCDSMGRTRHSETPNPAPSTDRCNREWLNPSGRHGNERRTPNSDGYTSVDSGPSNTDILPDILNSHMPPPYSTLPPLTDRGGRRLPPPSHPPPPPPTVAPMCGTPGTVLPACPHSPPRRSMRRGGFRPFPPRDRLRSSGRTTAFSNHAASESEEPKHCCGVMVTQTVSIRWFIVMIAFVGLCCAIVGTVLGALKATGREHLTVSLLMIGVGIVLITVSGIAWRLTSHDAPSCRAMLGLQTNDQEPNRRFVPRVPPYGRPPHPYAAMMYPEFQYRPPPPSYQASMQEYRLRLLLLDRQQGTTTTSLSPVSPPPTYRSHGSTLHSRPPLNMMERDYSRPPSYRSRASSAGVLRTNTDTLDSRVNEREGTISQNGTPASPSHSQSHSRNPSLSLSFLSHESLFVDSNHSRPTDSANAATSDNTNPVHFTSPSGESQNSVVAGLSDESPLATHEITSTDIVPVNWRAEDQSLWSLRKNHDINAVTIVQTTDSSQVLNQDTVVVSISGQTMRSSATTPGSGSQGEVQILAHV